MILIYNPLINCFIDTNLYILLIIEIYIYFDEKTKTLYEYVENTIYKIKSDIFNNMSEITSNEVIGYV